MKRLISRITEILKGKKGCLFMFLFVISASFLCADFKIMGGVNLSRYRVSPDDSSIDWNYKPGFLGGIGFEKKFNHNILLEFDILYFQKGSREEHAGMSDSEMNDSDWNFRLDVLSIPVFLRFRFLDHSSPYVLGGIEFSGILSHTKKKKEEEAIDLEETTQRIDYGLVFGCGYEIEIQEYLFFFVEARYHLGQANITISVVENEWKKTNSILIVVGMRS
ncbi:MAG: porin family protein [Candidatus Aminicenantaceae bacterium]